MSQLVEVLYPLPDLRRTPWSALRWWESKRLTYNRIVGTAGLVTLPLAFLIALLPPHGSVIPPLGMLVASAAYGVLANVCYSLGWVAEMVARRVWGRRAPVIGPLLFRQGLIFSVGLTLLPVLMLTLVWIARIVSIFVA